MPRDRLALKDVEKVIVTFSRMAEYRIAATIMLPLILNIIEYE